MSDNLAQMFLASIPGRGEEPAIIWVSREELHHMITAYVQAVRKARQTMVEASVNQEPGPGGFDWSAYVVEMDRMEKCAITVQDHLAPGPYVLTIPQWYSLLNKFDGDRVQDAAGVSRAAKMEAERLQVLANQAHGNLSSLKPA
jgi:hypothetical protein